MVRNTLTKKNYFIEILFLTIFALVWHNNLFFRSITGKTAYESRFILILLVVVSLAINTALTYKWRRSTFTIAASLIIPIGIYVFVSYWVLMAKFLRFLLICSILVMIAALCFAQISDFDNYDNKYQRMDRAKKTYLILRMIGVIAATVLLTSVFLKIYVIDRFDLSDSLFSGVVEEDIEEYEEVYEGITSDNVSSSELLEEFTIANNIDTVLLLQESEWEKLDLDERVDVLRCICNIERRYLGIYDDISIYVESMPDTDYGYYSNAENAIFLSKEKIESDPPQETLDTLCHEMFHAAQFRYVEIYDNLSDEDKNSFFLYDASVYSEEFRNYIDYDYTDDPTVYIEYYGQQCEEDARTYASTSVEDYYSRIEKYLAEQISSYCGSCG